MENEIIRVVWKPLVEYNKKYNKNPTEIYKQAIFLSLHYAFCLSFIL